MIRKTFEWTLFAALLALLVVIGAGSATAADLGAKSGTLEFTVTVPFGGSGNGLPLLLVGRARHIRVYTTGSDVTFYGIVKVLNSAGQWTGNTTRKPYGEASKFPPAAANLWNPLPATSLIWNPYVDLGVDSLFVYNTHGSVDAEVTFQLILE